MIYFFLWIILCFVVSSIGHKRKIGAGPAFFAALFLSPIIGIIIVAFSDKISEADKSVSRLMDQAHELTFDSTKKDEYELKLKQVISLKPLAPDAHYRLSYLYAHNEKKDKAKEHLTKALQQGFEQLSEISKNPVMNNIYQEVKETF